MTRRVIKAKSRVTAETVRVEVRPPERQEDKPPAYSGHTGGSFAEAGYTAGRGTFGFRQDTVQ
jgi:hypothetical protein